MPDPQGEPGTQDPKEAQEPKTHRRIQESHWSPGSQGNPGTQEPLGARPYMGLSVLFNYTNPAPSDHRKPRENDQKQPKIGLPALPGSCWLPGSSWLAIKKEILA